MSGCCLQKRGKTISCNQCEQSGLNLKDNYCSNCGEEVIMRWDMDRDCNLDEEEE